MEANNTFSKGLSSDLSSVSLQKDTYTDAHDIRIVTDSGKSTFALSNMKGHTFSFSLNSTSSVNSISFTGAIGDTSPLLLSLDANIDTFTPATWSTYADLYQQLADFINNSSFLQANGTYNAYAQPNQVILYSPDTQATIVVGIINTDYNTAIVVPSESNFFLIGYTLIREEIILITTPNQTPNPGGIDPNLPPDPESSGQIWSLTFDGNGNPVLVLLYNNLINLTAEHPIPSPGAIVGRYETSSIKGVYFTDFFNRPRRINIADPLAFGYTVQELFLQSNINSSLPVLTRVLQAGSVKTGMHQFAYRLKNSSGAETVFSPPSNLVSVIRTNEESVVFGEYIDCASDIVSGKSLSYNIPNVDTKYDRIEVIDIFYKNESELIPEINLFLDEPVGNSTSFSFTFTGTETFIPITVDEYTTFQTEIVKVKALVSKNNRLIEGNIVERRLDFSYDSRVFRYDYQGNTYVDANDIADLTSDCINPSQSPIPHEVGYIYQDIATTGGTLIFGGTGANISYEFVPDSTSIGNQDSDALTAQVILDNQPFNWSGPPYRSVARRTFDHNLNNELRPVTNTFDIFGSSQTSSVVRGYTRDEVYRFGIVFFDLLGNPGFVNWIGDIRMPHVYMPAQADPTDDTLRELAFNPTRDNGSSQEEGYSLGVKFTVNIPQSIKSQVSGYSIVRVERKEKDKTILGQGILMPGWKLSGYDDCFLVDEGFDPDGALLGVSPNVVAAGFQGLSVNVAASPNTVTVSPDFATFHCPEHLFGTVDFNFQNGDALDCVGILDNYGTFNAFRSAGIPVDAGPGVSIPSSTARGWASKNYIYSNTPPVLMFSGGANYEGTFPIRSTKTIEANEAPYVHKGADLVTDITVYNNSIVRDVSLPPVACFSGGTKCLVVAPDDYTFGGSSFASLGSFLEYDSVITVDNGGGSYTYGLKLLVVNYKRSLLNQYGGNTYNQRSNSVYIPTGHYVRLDDTVNNVVTSTVYGGDTFIEVLDTVPRRKSCPHNNNIFGVMVDDDAQYRTFKGQFFPTETTLNIDLRRSTNGLIAGYVLNKNFVPDVIASPSGLDLREEYLINPTFSRESGCYFFIPRPDPFNDVSEFDSRIRASEEKVNGELVDSWSNFKVGTYIDVDGIYGPINGLIVNKDRLFFFQDRGLGTVDVNARSLVQDQTGEAIQIGSSGLLARFDYISTEIGSKHQWSILQGNNNIYFLDAFKKKYYKLSGEGIESLSEIKGLNGYFNTHIDGTVLSNDNPILGKGVVSTFDYKFSEVYLTFRNSRIVNNQSVKDYWTIAYNENTNSFTSFYTFTPPIYVNSVDKIFSSENKTDYYRHNTGPYNVFYNNPPTRSRVRIVVADTPERTKYFDVAKWVTEVYNELVQNNVIANDTWTRLRFFTDTQNSGYITLVPKPQSGYNVARNLNREWSMHIPRDAVKSGLIDVDILNTANLDTTQLFKPRLRDNYLTIDLEYDNNNNYKFVCPFVITSLRTV